MLIRFWTAIYRGSFISFLPVCVFHILWTDRIGICPICISLAIFCEKLSLLWIKFLSFSLQKSLHLTESLQSPSAFLSHFIYRGLYGLQTKYRRAFFTLALLLEGRLIDNRYGEAEKVHSVRKIIHPNRLKSSGNIFSFSMWLAACRGRETATYSLSQEEKAPLFSHHKWCVNVKSDTFVMTKKFLLAKNNCFIETAMKVWLNTDEHQILMHFLRQVAGVQFQTPNIGWSTWVYSWLDKELAEWLRAETSGEWS